MIMATLQTDTQTLRHGTMSRFGEGTAVCETAFFLMLFFVAQIFLPEIVKKNPPTQAVLHKHKQNHCRLDMMSSGRKNHPEKGFFLVNDR